MSSSIPARRETAAGRATPPGGEPDDPDDRANAHRDGSASDAEVVARSLDDPAEFAVLFDRHAVAIRGYLARRLGADLADDLVGQTFLVAFDGRGRYDPARHDARPWLYGIATTLLRRHRRDEVRGYRALARAGSFTTAHTVGHADAVIDGVDAGVSVRQIADALAALAHGERDALLLYAWGDLSYQEIADSLQIAVGTVRSRLNRARRRLRPLLAENPAATAALPRIEESR
jgi:RNA polymerase sigma factor (sigma-70 family)